MLVFLEGTYIYILVASPNLDISGLPKNFYVIYQSRFVETIGVSRNLVFPR